MKFTALKRTAAVATVAAFALAGAPAHAQDVTLKIGWTTSDGEQDPYAITARQFAEALETLSPGTFEVQYFPNNQLGDEKEMVEGLKFGTLDVGVITNAVIANVEPAFQINDLPFLYGSHEQAHRILDGSIGNRLMAKLRDNGIVGLGFSEGGFRHMINNSKPVNTPADVEGVKYRTMQNPVFINMFESLGGNANPMAWSEVYTAVQQGTVDGLEIPVAVIHNNKFAEVTEYLSLTRHTYSALGILMSEKTYNELTLDQRITVWRAAEIAETEERMMNRANVETLIGKLEDEGMQVNQVENPGAFRDKVKPVYDRFKDEIGADLMEDILSRVQ